MQYLIFVKFKNIILYKLTKKNKPLKLVIKFNKEDNNEKIIKTEWDYCKYSIGSITTQFHPGPFLLQPFCGDLYHEHHLPYH